VTRSKPWLILASESHGVGARPTAATAKAGVEVVIIAITAIFIIIVVL
jgi:hypothetical protein